MGLTMIKRRKRFTKRGFRLRLKNETVFSVAQVCFLILAGITLISFTRQGEVLLKLNNLLWKYFSWSSLFLPFIFLAFAFLISKVKFILGQPNVVVGTLLFFVSVAALGHAGIFGLVIWESISALVTAVGAGIIFIGLAAVGLIILFNTSIDQVYKLITEFFRQVGFFVHGRESQLKIGGRALSKGPMKVSEPAKPPPSPGAPKEPLEQKLVSRRY
jgi:S-DNA-T family DNA segregation ATPase FtsK/SpoIIIE